ncbi:oligoendopeptidase F [Paenactinomyces guangxiensis]|uniref:Oligopeptidase F n=1 Tax=Paenactinomyces guangxiensis TaxID=1490290 RepID=A0A7W2A8R1_9BACL|nr:oligoendopeptidase F [Paenactinomyces guangxiensis]MBA4494432.1 oligoendopeptidase F [Paenactinomyces guangxiensis]MBH8591513.1 oligoendopeptidase F [Paenactinomyces guangxiensis]
MTEQNHTKKLPLRSEIPEEYTWRLEDIFETDEAWEQEFKRIKKMLPKIGEFKGKLGNSANNLLAALQYKDEVDMRLGKLFTYARMRYDQDTTNSFYQALNDRATILYTEASSMKAYIVPEILAISEETIQTFLNENSQLRVYKQALDELNRKRPHVLSATEEAILSQAADVMRSSGNTFGMLNNADLKFPSIVDEDGNRVEVTHGRFVHFLESSDRRVRKEAFHAVYHTYGEYKNTFASTLSGAVKKNNFFARVRKYQSARQAALNSNHIPETVYDQLVHTVNDHLHLLHKYVSIKKRALGLSDLHMYDLYTPLIKDVKFKVTYKEAQEILLKGLKPLGEEYLAILREAFQNRWVDVYENKGKRSGAYSSGAYGTNPYILMNWQDNIDNLFTLAHEFGHSLHSYYTRKTQPYVYGDYTIFVAEVASTCNESLLNDYLLKTTDDHKKRLYLLNHYLESFRSTVFRQTMFAEFEHLIHQKAQDGEALTPDLLTSLYYDLNKKYYGNEINIDQEIGLEWARIPHFYYNYYVYQYSTGFSAATALSRQILEEGQPAVDRYLKFLNAGSSDYPIEILKQAGVDMTSPEPIRQALQVFAEKLDEMEQLLFTL